MILNANQVKSYLYNAGFRGSHLTAAIDIAYCESKFDTTAHNTTGEDSRGLMQINVAPNANPQFASWDLFNPAINTKAAYLIYKNRNYTFYDWTCARSLNLVNPKQTDYLPFLALAIFGIVLYISS